MILLIDNYDSFTFNLAAMIEKLGEKVIVRRNDKISLEEVDGLGARGVVLSPGPGNPNDAGICLELVKRFHQKIPILGICLGHQVIAQVFGQIVEGAGRIVHGKCSQIYHDDSGVFRGVKQGFKATRYHSLHVREFDSKELRITARTPKNQIMGIRHSVFPVEGVQFHPESYATECGGELVENFLRRTK